MKVFRYFLCFVIILVGIYCGVRLYQEVTKSSYVNGTINVENEFRKESFFYSSTSVAFYPGNNATTYDYSIELTPVDDIDLTNKNYDLYFMNFPVINAEMKSGLINLPVLMNFYNSDGTLACKGKMNVKIEFLSKSTKLKLSCNNQTSANYFEQYFADYGFKLQLVEILGE